MTSVLHVITGLGPGGAETQLDQLASALHKSGMRQHVVSLRGRGTHADTLEEAGVAVTALGVKSAPTGAIGLLRLARLVRRLQPRVIHGWMYHGNAMAALAHRFARKGTRLMWNIRASNMDNARYGGIIRLNARLSRWPDVVVTNSHAALDLDCQHGFRPKCTVVIANGIDTTRFRPDAALRKAARKELGLAEDAVTAIVVARVDPMKDHETFLKALSDLPDVQGLLVGAKTNKLDLPANVRALGLRHDIDRLLQAADLIVSSSAFGEGFSNALAEGMSSGLVPVSTDVGDSGLIVGDTGHIVPPGDTQKLRDAIATETNLSRSQRRSRGLAARQRILDRFALEQAVDAYARLYGADG